MTIMLQVFIRQLMHRNLKGIKASTAHVAPSKITLAALSNSKTRKALKLTWLRSTTLSESATNPQKKHRTAVTP